MLMSSDFSSDYMQNNERRNYGFDCQQNGACHFASLKGIYSTQNWQKNQLSIKDMKNCSPLSVLDLLETALFFSKEQQ